MMSSNSEPTPEASKETIGDPRSTLASWANHNDEWLRYIARQVISTSRPLSASDIDYAYQLFRQEKLIDKRTLPPEDELAVAARAEEVEEPLVITKLSNVQGVNALTPGAVIEPHADLTVLYGENGTGKTGYARILKALANSRTADEILGNIRTSTEIEKSASIEYTLGNTQHSANWVGQLGLSPFTRMAIFDTPAVNIHLDADLEYVYVPSVLSLFNHVTAAIQAVQRRLDQDIQSLRRATPELLSRFPRESSIYPQIETLGAATNLEELRALAAFGEEPKAELDHLVQAVAALEANTAGAEIPAQRRLSAVLREAETALEQVSSFDIGDHNQCIVQVGRLRKDQATLREELFAAASLPAAPDGTWSAFIASGEAYKRHLQDEGLHDEARCLYCRQPLNQQAADLLNRYSDYLADRLSADIQAAERTLETGRASVAALVGPGMVSFLSEQESIDERSPRFDLINKVSTLATDFRTAVTAEGPVEPEQFRGSTELLTEVQQAKRQTEAHVTELEERQQNRQQALLDAKAKGAELQGRVELAAMWDQVEAKVRDNKLAARIEILVKKMPNYLRHVTGLAKSASDELINQSFDELFAEECKHLRAPPLDVQFVGRDGKPQRRRTLGKSYKPSKILSEGEQKILAIADFLAEARLTGITAPIIFDDPVSSLDHRRIDEVANRIALLTADNQVIVFTHDILFASKLLSLFEKSKNCKYYAVDDEGGKGRVVSASGPRLDTLNSLRGRINSKIEAANVAEGEAKDSLIRETYSLIRAWCEIFSEEELLGGVTRRYQPNVRMTTLPELKLDAMAPAIGVVTRIFDEACRHTEAHSQPAIALGVAPSLTGLREHWRELQECRETFKHA